MAPHCHKKYYGLGRRTLSLLTFFRIFPPPSRRDFFYLQLTSWYAIFEN